MKRKLFTVLNLVVLCMTIFSSVNAKSVVDDKENARVFVQKFYDWYIVLSATSPNLRRGSEPDIIALNQHSEYFDAKLRKAIIDDRLAQSKANEIVGLDYDPFLNAQDTGFGYQTGNVKQIENKFFIDIHSDNEKKSRKAILVAKVAVIAEVVKVNGQWVFVNFIYPVNGKQYNLLDELKGLREDSKKTKNK